MLIFGNSSPTPPHLPLVYPSPPHSLSSYPPPLLPFPHLSSSSPLFPILLSSSPPPFLLSSPHTPAPSHPHSSPPHLPPPPPPLLFSSSSLLLPSPTPFHLSPSSYPSLSLSSYPPLSLSSSTPLVLSSPPLLPNSSRPPFLLPAVPFSFPILLSSSPTPPPLLSSSRSGVRRPYFSNHLVYVRVSWSMVKISTMTTAKIQIFHGQNGQPTVLPRNLTKNHQFLPWP